MDRNKSKKDRTSKRVIFSLIKGLIVIAVGIGLYISIYGMGFLDLPDAENIQSVSISYPEKTDKIIELTSPEDIETTLKITKALQYRIFKKPADNEQPLISISYHLKNGDTKIISANATTVWWKGRAHVIKEKDLFINATKGLFFSEE